ncbi:MAG: F0F1 ATP synthase subunit B [Candidatus Omnitrophica bacterium]|nr:F0F1 ATP synthase subunit B [Candidatus Omnitrophota bacterium]
MLAQILTTALGFFLLVLILRKLFWGAMLQMLDERRHRIEDGLQRIARSQQETERLQAEYTQRLAGIEEEARAKIQQAILEGKRVSVEIQEQAREQGHALLNKAKDTIELEIGKAKVTLRDEMVALAVEALERVLRRKVDEKADRHLVESVLDELEREHAKA